MYQLDKNVSIYLSAQLSQTINDSDNYQLLIEIVY